MIDTGIYLEPKRIQLGRDSGNSRDRRNSIPPGVSRYKDHLLTLACVSVASMAWSGTGNTNRLRTTKVLKTTINLLYLPCCSHCLRRLLLPTFSEVYIVPYHSVTNKLTSSRGGLLWFSLSTSYAKNCSTVSIAHPLGQAMY